MKYRGIFEYEYPTKHKPPVSIDVHLHGDCVKGKIIEWEYRPLEQEPTAKNDLGIDLISRQEAIDTIRQLYLDLASQKAVIDILKVLPSVTPQEPRWIPVSERLPEDRREVLVTAYWHETYQVMMASYYGDGLWWCVPFNNCGEHMQRSNPKAWMPLPKAYKEVKE